MAENFLPAPPAVVYLDVEMLDAAPAPDHNTAFYQVIQENLELAIAAVEAQPDNLFDLGNFKAESECGTLFCTAGLLTTVDHFKFQGMYLTEQRIDGFLRTRLRLKENRYGQLTYEYLDSMFGKNAFSRLFEAPGEGAWDDEIASEYRENWANSMLSRGEDFQNCIAPQMRDKELAIERLKSQLNLVMTVLDPSNPHQIDV